MLNHHARFVLKLNRELKRISPNAAAQFQGRQVNDQLIFDMLHTLVALVDLQAVHTAFDEASWWGSANQDWLVDLQDGNLTKTQLIDKLIEEYDEWKTRGNYDISLQDDMIDSPFTGLGIYAAPSREGDFHSDFATFYYEGFFSGMSMMEELDMLNVLFPFMEQRVPSEESMAPIFKDFMKHPEKYPLLSQFAYYVGLVEIDHNPFLNMAENLMPEEGMVFAWSYLLELLEFWKEAKPIREASYQAITLQGVFLEALAAFDWS